MSFISDIIADGTKVIADVASGKVATATDDLDALFRRLADGCTSVGDFLRAVGFQASAVGCTPEEVEAFVAAGREFVRQNKAKAFGPKVGTFDPNKWYAALEAFLTAFTAIWNLFKPAPAPTP